MFGGTMYRLVGYRFESPPVYVVFSKRMGEPQAVLALDEATLDPPFGPGLTYEVVPEGTVYSNGYCRTVEALRKG